MPPFAVRRGRSTMQRRVISAASRLLDLLENASGAVAAGILVFIVGAMLLEVIARTWFSAPQVWVYGATEYALLYIAFLGMARVARSQGHVRVDIVTDRLREPSRNILAAMVALVATVLCGAFAVWGAMVTIDSFHRGIVTEDVIRIPRYLVLWVIPFGFALTTLEFLRQLACSVVEIIESVRASTS